MKIDEAKLLSMIIKTSDLTEDDIAEIRAKVVEARADFEKQLSAIESALDFVSGKGGEIDEH